MSRTEGRVGVSREEAPFVAVLGAGVMGGALLSAFIAAGQPAQACRATTRTEPSAAPLRDQGVTVTNNVEAVRGADVVLVAVKPGDVGAVLDEVGSELSEGAVVVSVAAGLSLSALAEHVPAGTAIIRVMPNTPSLVGEGMSAMSPNEAVTQGQLSTVRSLFEGAGSVVVVDERYQDAVTGISGSGPAYVFYVAEALIDAGVGQGLPRPTATELAVQTILGAATMMRAGEASPAVLRERVTSPGGTTAAGLAALDASGVRTGVARAVSAVVRRSRELGEVDPRPGITLES